jgi:hypothetical protein
MPAETTERDGIVSCSQIGVEGKFIDMEAVIDFTDQADKRYVIKYGMMGFYQLKNRLQIDRDFQTSKHIRSENFNPENSTMIVLCLAIIVYFVI